MCLCCIGFALVYAAFLSILLQTSKKRLYLTLTALPHPPSAHLLWYLVKFQNSSHDFEAGPVIYCCYVCHCERTFVFFI